MRVAFYANLEFGKNTGSLSLPMDGSLSGAKNSGVIPLKITCSGGTGGYIFYANIADEQHPLDVIRFLENSFGCDLPNFELEINGAGFFIFFADDSKSAINDIFPETQNFMPVSISENANVKNAVCFWITADIHAGLFNNLIKIGGKNEDGKLALLAVFSGETTGKTAFENAEFMAKLPTFELLKIFEFSEVVFKYTFGKAKSFWINGKVCVHLFGNEFGFMVTATVDEERLFVESVMNNDKHLSLFGGAMAGITFTELYLNITHVFETEKSDSSTEILVKASASFGGVSCSGALYLSGGTPALAQISLGEEEDFSFANFFNSVTGANLPSDVFDLSFKCGSSLYYNNSGGTFVHDGVTYESGFHLNVLMALKFWFVDLDISGIISIDDKKVSADIHIGNGSYVINLYIIKISDPHLFISVCENESAEIGVRGNVTILGIDFGSLAIHISKSPKNGEMIISGEWETPSSFQNYFIYTRKIGFNYGKEAGLSFTGLTEFMMLKEICDFADRLKGYLNSLEIGGLCEKIGDFIAGKLITSTCSVAPEFDYEDAIRIKLNVVCRISFAGESCVLTTLRVPFYIELEEGEEITLSNIMGSVDQNLLNNIDVIFKALVNDPEKFAIVLAAIIGKDALSTLSAIVCRGLIDAALSALIDVAAKEAAAAFADALANGASYLAGLTLIRKILSGGKGGGGDEGGDGGDDDDKGGGEFSLPKLPKPENLAFKIEAEQITLTWNKVAEATIYAVTVYSDENTKISSERINGEKSEYICTLPENYSEKIVIFGVAASDGVKLHEDSDESKITANLPEKADIVVKIISAELIGVQIEVVWEKQDVITHCTVTIKKNGHSDITFSVENTGNVKIQFDPYYGTGEYLAFVTSSERTEEPQTEPFVFNIAIEDAVRACFDFNYSAEKCFEALNLSEYEPENTVHIFAKSGYQIIDVFELLRVNYSYLTALKIVFLLISSYGVPLSENAEAESQYIGKNSGGQCAEHLLTIFPEISAEKLVLAMKNAGYDTTAVAIALKSAFASLDNYGIIGLIIKIFA